MKKAPDTGKQFESIVNARLAEVVAKAWLRRIDRTPDGMKLIPAMGRIPARLAAQCKTPADFTGMRHDGRLVYVEAKRTEKGSLSVEPTEEEALRIAANRAALGKPARKSAPSGDVSRHQLDAIIDAHEAGAVGLLVVCFAAPKIDQVIALPGSALVAWRDGFDVKGNFASISHEHFAEYGWLLGSASNWKFEAHCFEPARKEESK